MHFIQCLLYMLTGRQVQQVRGCVQAAVLDETMFQQACTRVHKQGKEHGTQAASTSSMHKQHAEAGCRAGSSSVVLCIHTRAMFNSPSMPKRLHSKEHVAKIPPAESQERELLTWHRQTHADVHLARWLTAEVLHLSYDTCEHMCGVQQAHAVAPASLLYAKQCEILQTGL